jgi:hypothetical protein
MQLSILNNDPRGARARAIECASLSSKVSHKKAEGAVFLYGRTLTGRVWGVRGRTPALLRFEASEGGRERSMGDSPKYDGAVVRLVGPSWVGQDSVPAVAQ